MKVNGPMSEGGKDSMAHVEMRVKQNGKKSQSLRAAALKGTMSKKKRRMNARKTND